MSPRGKIQNETMRAETLSKISGAALRSFAEYGYHGATLKRIAETSGLSYGLVYHYFPSKEAVFCELVDFALESTISAMRMVLSAPGTAWERLESYSKMLVENALSGESSLYFLVMIQALTQGKAIGGLLDHIGDRVSVYYDTLVPLVAQAQESGEAAPGDPVVLVAAYLSFVQGLALLVHQGKGLETKITTEILTSVLRGGRG